MHTATFLFGFSRFDWRFEFIFLLFLMRDVLTFLLKHGVHMRYALNNRMNMRKRRIIVAAAGIQFNRNIDSLINQNTAYEKKRIYGMRDGCDCDCNVCKTQNYFYGINRMAPTTIYPHIYSIPSIERQTYHNKCMQCNRNVNFSSADMYTLFLRFDS